MRGSAELGIEDEQICYNYNEIGRILARNVTHGGIAVIATSPLSVRGQPAGG